jgi:hypothetical protein
MHLRFWQPEGPDVWNLPQTQCKICVFTVRRMSHCAGFVLA